MIWRRIERAGGETRNGFRENWNMFFIEHVLHRKGFAKKTARLRKHAFTNMPTCLSNGYVNRHAYHPCLF
ncbi:MAG: hypothetical protein BAA01_02260 [Bacillus thermozeamaize]|uniref:Uncharacterized protein n=1 Tax=Bacillus thermozeamaize TaxID=230954 RepID=A0A1Y3PUG5_9BACI|nr:MAG: hypothetical protein BAA01_02260 [Bacillus thermozeamaize]